MEEGEQGVGQCNICDGWGWIGTTCSDCEDRSGIYETWTDPNVYYTDDCIKGSLSKCVRNPRRVGSLAYFLGMIAKGCEEMENGYNDSWCGDVVKKLVMIGIKTVENLLLNLPTVNDRLLQLPPPIAGPVWQFTDEHIEVIQRVGIAWLAGARGENLQTMFEEPEEGQKIVCPETYIPKLAKEEAYVRKNGVMERWGL